jgi:hypothetical protein
MQLTRLLATAGIGLLAAHPSPSQDAPTDPDRTLAGGLLGDEVDHTLDAPIAALAGHRR